MFLNKVANKYSYYILSTLGWFEFALALDMFIEHIVRHPIMINLLFSENIFFLSVIICIFIFFENKKNWIIKNPLHKTLLFQIVLHLGVLFFLGALIYSFTKHLLALVFTLI
jgi:hypothetical protein